MPIGRFAPSPTGRLHLGNLRTALVSWLAARTDGSELRLRFDDLDRSAVRTEHYGSQPDDLRALGLDWDGPPVRQSQRLARYREAVERLVATDLVYPCYCSRREIREAVQAPNRALAGHRYPGTCRELTAPERRARTASGRPPALRLRGDEAEVGFADLVVGDVAYPVDDFVIQRNDGTPAYHLVTVVDDADLGVELVVRADDLLDSTSRQLHVARLLDLPTADHAHVPLVLSPDGERLAKRHGSVTLDDRAVCGEDPANVLSFLAASLELCPPGEPVTPSDLIERFDLVRLPTKPLVLERSFLDCGDRPQKRYSETV
ncbi:MAG: tRNA glutamyl-Q(34) synthetase GluQRS [Acidimicrobiia bacterium]|nr:tRNA glutamyl-Q(34) synthetase GluQRS [Acidimicrobiia bacterium]